MVALNVIILVTLIVNFMTITSYIKKLQKLADKHPKAKVVYSTDDEGNSFSEVHFEPSVGAFSNGSFESNEEDDSLKVNAVCIN